MLRTSLAFSALSLVAIATACSAPVDDSAQDEAAFVRTPPPPPKRDGGSGTRTDDDNAGTGTSGGDSTCLMSDDVPAVVIDYSRQGCFWTSCGAGATSSNYMSPRCTQSGGTHEAVFEIVNAPATGDARAGVTVSTQNANEGIGYPCAPSTVSAIVFGHASDGWRELGRVSGPATCGIEKDLSLTPYFANGNGGHDKFRVALSAVVNASSPAVFLPVTLSIYDPRFVH